MKLEEIELIAQKYVEILQPYCQRIAIAGSIRRKKPECNDVEIVLVRDDEKIGELVRIVDSWTRIKGRITGRYTQVVIPEGLKLDLFIADSKNWGNIFLIRTGSWRFSKWCMGSRAKQLGMIHRGGYLWKDGKKVICEEEEHVFLALNMVYIPPELRSWE